MKTNSTSQSAFIKLRLLLALSASVAGVALAIFATRPSAEEQQLPQYMPVAGGNTHDEAAGLSQMELFWNDRVTFPTGRFNPAWVRAAAAQHASMPAGIPFGRHVKLNMGNPNALSTTSFTALGPQPERMTGCTGCFDYTRTEGRVNTIAVDPTTTTNGSIVA